MKRSPVILILVALLAGGGTAFAQRAGPPTLDQAVQQVRRTTQGRVLSAETVTVGARRVHRIKVLTDDGRVRTIEMDAAQIAPRNGNPDNANPALVPKFTDPALTPKLRNTRNPPREPRDEPVEPERENGREKDG